MKTKTLKQKKTNEHMSVAGLDISASATGITVFGSSRQHLRTDVIIPKFSNVKPLMNLNIIDVKRKFEFARILYISYEILKRCYQDNVVFAIIEGYAFGARGRAVTKLPELGGVIKLFLSEAGIKWLEITPQQNKKFINGKGVCPKAVLVKDIYKYYGEEFEEIPDSCKEDAADSYGLGLIAYYLTFGWKWQKALKRTQLDVIQKVAKESKVRNNFDKYMYSKISNSILFEFNMEKIIQ